MSEREPICIENEKILFVDDDSMMAEVMRNFLEVLGHEAEIFTNPTKAIKSFKEKPDDFDLVISDLNFKGFEINGKDLIRAIRKIRAEIAAILLTGGDAKTIRDEIQTDDILVLEKPVPLEMLGNAIEEILGTAGEATKLSAAS